MVTESTSVSGELGGVGEVTMVTESTSVSTLVTMVTERTSTVLVLWLP